MKELKNLLIESTINEAKIKLSDNIRDFKSVIMPGQTEMGVFGVIIGKPFGAMDKAGQKAAEDLVGKLGLLLDYSFKYVIDDFKEEGYDVNEMTFCYFMEAEHGVTVNCYSFGDGGVYIIK